MRITLCLLAALCAVVSCKNVKVEEAGVHVKVLEQAGLVFVGRSDNDKDRNAIKINVAELKERKRDGKEVGKKKGKKHRMEGMDKLKFAVTDASDSTCYDIECKEIKVSKKLENNATLNLQVMIFKKNGTFDIGDENHEVARGNVKVNLEVEGWDFCGDDGESCEEGDADYLTAGLVVHSRGKPKKKAKGKNKMATYDLESGAITLSNKFQQPDGVWSDLPESPEFETRGNKNFFIFKFPKFSGKIKYDPTIEAGETSDVVGDGGTENGGKSIIAIPSLILLFTALAII